MVKRIVLSILFVISYWICPGQNIKKPNVIVIYTDDQGAVDLGSYGATDLHTPNLDRLAAEGTRFTQAYVAAPVCAPSRAALLTGRYPQNAGVTGNTSPNPGSHGMPEEQYTLAELFKDNGYQTGHIGKWHLGMSRETSPNNQGFDYSFGHLRGCIDNYSHFFFWQGPNIHDLYENGKEVFYDGQYFPDLASKKALNYIDENHKDPFFMYYAINMPHYPYQPTQKWRDHYEGMPQPRADYAAFISTIDERIGHLLDKLDALGIRENTIIIYQSDNGYSTEARAFNGGGSSGPYRGAKNSLLEGGIRLPAMISWKGNLPEKIVNDQFLMNIDWMPTLASLCKLKKKPGDIDGLDQSQMITDPGAKTSRNLGYWKYGSQWVVRKGSWKLVGYPKDTSHKGKLDLEKDALFLSDLSMDVSEMSNMAAQHPDKVSELVETYLSWEHGSESDLPVKTETNLHLAKDALITATTPLHPNYKNIETLVDGRRGYPDYSSGQWIGLEDQDLEVLVDLKSIKKIKSIELGYLYTPSNWIFEPVSMDLSFSEDGIKFDTTLSSKIRQNRDKKKIKTHKFSLQSQRNSRYIKIRIKGVGKCPSGFDCDGQPAWFFIDEITVN